MVSNVPFYLELCSSSLFLVLLCRFIILFVLMACFSGCGYYKQRQRLLRSPEARNNGGFFSVFHGTDRYYHRDAADLASRDPDLQHRIRAQASGPGRFWSIFQVPNGFRRTNLGVVTLDTGYQSSRDGYRGHDSTSPSLNISGAVLQPPPYSEVYYLIDPIYIKML